MKWLFDSAFEDTKNKLMRAEMELDALKKARSVHASNFHDSVALHCLAKLLAENGIPTNEQGVNRLVSNVYRIADAMLAQRNGGGL